MEIIIDPKSGFCFGVKQAISQAEQQAKEKGKIYCLGEIVHNSEEVDRLTRMGVNFISREEFGKLKNTRVLIRAHGEPPETYQYAQQNNIKLIDATCPVVLKLQDRIRGAKRVNPHAQIMIYGKKDHPEVVGLNAQVEEALIIESKDELEKISVDKPVFIFSQTTKDREKYKEIVDLLEKRFEQSGKSRDDIVVYNSICGQVANRAPWLKEFSSSVDYLIFVGGKNSSNSRILFNVCKAANENSFFITKEEEARALKLPSNARVGICGATSTPLWLIENVASTLEKNN